MRNAFKDNYSYRCVNKDRILNNVFVEENIELLRERKRERERERERAKELPGVPQSSGDLCRLPNINRAPKSSPDLRTKPYENLSKTTHFQDKLAETFNKM